MGIEGEREAGRQSERQAGREAGRQAGRQAGRGRGRQASKQLIKTQISGGYGRSSRGALQGLVELMCFKTESCVCGGLSQLHMLSLHQAQGLLS